jgi:prepilin-type processing-associated H-X9-DG protein
MSDHLMVDAWLPDGSNATVDAKRHGSTSNYIFCDCHAVPAIFKSEFDPPNGVNHFDPNLVPCPSCP